jgi:Tol biopolymer transport system component/DNA-binding winged helix-turn-helix (wHTH) protein
MNKDFRHFYEFGPFRLDTADRLLLRGREVVPLTPKAFDMLLALVENSGHVLEKDELMKRVWPDSFVEEANLSNNVFTIRKALGEDRHGHKYIETVPRRGYRFVASVREVRDEGVDLMLEEHSREHVLIEEEKEDAAPIKTEPTGTGTEGRALTLKARNAETLIHAGSGVASFVGRIKQNKLAAMLVLATPLLAVALLLLSKSGGQNQPASRPEESFGRMKLSRLTTDGKAGWAAISPDGKYVVHQRGNRGELGLWLRQVETASSVQIAPPIDGVYIGLTYSPNGSYVYYVKRDHSTSIGTLYKVPVLGGASTKLVTDIDTPITFSPDGKRMAFVRGYLNEGKVALMIANTDGTGERRVVARSLREFAYAWPSWSPDGEVIAVALGSADVGNNLKHVVTVRVKDGVEKQLTSQSWPSIRQIAWLADGSGLIITAPDQGSDSGQLWHISHPEGSARRMTNDLNDYRGISLTPDSSVLATVQAQQISDIWVVPDADSSRAVQITSGKSDGHRGLAWTPDGSIVYSSMTSGNPDIWIINADGTDNKQLTVDAAMDTKPCVTSDGRYIVFLSTRTGEPHVWRMNRDGSEPKQLTMEGEDNQPQCSPDGQWVVYQHRAGTLTALWKVSINGGTPTRLTDKYSGAPAVSPQDGMIAYHYFDDEANPPKYRLGVIPLEGGSFIKQLDVPVIGRQVIRWAADGRSITYIDFRTPVDNIWKQTLDDSPPVQVTNFKADRIFQFAWSPDGKHLALARGVIAFDVILISNFR